MIEKQQLVKIVGAANVSYDPDTLEGFSRDISFVNQVRPACVVKPRKTGDVQALIKAANETHTPLVPVSSGAPHFRGDTVPGTGGAIIVDMSTMNKIVFVDRPRRVAMVEPGVTFGELIAATAREGLRINMPLLPRKTKTVVGSLIEREPVIMPAYQWDVSDPLACVEIIFGGGEEFRTGQAAGPGTVKQQWAVGGLQKAPYGPGVASWHRFVQGAQGTVGIVTWASLRCEILPKAEESFVVGSSDLGVLTDLAAWLVRLRMVTECFILNNVNLAAIFSRRAKDYQALKDSLPAWTLFYTVAGYEYYPEERISSRVKDISEMTQRLGVEPVLSIGGLSAHDIRNTVQQPAADPYWKLRQKGACEDVFFLTINDKIADQLGAMNNVVDRAGYPASEMGVYLQPVTQGTGCHVEFNLFYDPANAKESNRVKDLTTDATRALMSRGAFFSRPYGINAGAVFNRDAATVTMLKKIKNMFDPNGIMNPGKVCF
jgi:FAD/FMN-containing dehydrogenase